MEMLTLPVTLATWPGISPASNGGFVGPRPVTKKLTNSPGEEDVR